MSELKKRNAEKAWSAKLANISKLAQQENITKLARYTAQLIRDHQSRHDLEEVVSAVIDAIADPAKKVTFLNDMIHHVSPSCMYVDIRFEEPELPTMPAVLCKAWPEALEALYEIDPIQALTAAHVGVARYSPGPGFAANESGHYFNVMSEAYAMLRDKSLRRNFEFSLLPARDDKYTKYHVRGNPADALARLNAEDPSKVAENLAQYVDAHKCFAGKQMHGEQHPYHALVSHYGALGVTVSFLLPGGPSPWGKNSQLSRYPREVTELFARLAFEASSDHKWLVKTTMRSFDNAAKCWLDKSPLEAAPAIIDLLNRYNGDQWTCNAPPEYLATFSPQALRKLCVETLPSPKKPMDTAAFLASLKNKLVAQPA